MMFLQTRHILYYAEPLLLRSLSSPLLHYVSVLQSILKASKSEQRQYARSQL